jgi:hypothetical protein
MAAAEEARKQDKIASGSKDMFGAMGRKKPKSNYSIQTPMAPAKAGVVKGARKPVSADDGIADDLRPPRIKPPVRYGKDGNEMIVNPLQTAEFRDYNGNGIEDRSEGIYRDSDYIRKPKNWGKNIAL